MKNSLVIRFIYGLTLLGLLPMVSFAQDPFAQQIDSLISLMTIEEKIGQLNLVNPGGAVTGSVVSQDVESKIKAGNVGAIFGVVGPEKVRRVQDMAVNDSRMKIPLLVGLDVIHGHKTIFPIPLAISCSWDMELIEQSAQIAAREATADGLNWVFSPMVDVSRDPRWGRVAEGSGEDAYLGSRIAQAMVKGYQGTDLADPYTVMACIKHFALYGASEAGRDYNTVDMSRMRMFEDYLPPFKTAIDAGVGSVMTSFNEIDGIPASGNKWLLTEVLRNRWGFQGLVISDYTSVNEMIAHGMGDLQAVSSLALKAGLDMDMVGEGFLTTLKKSLNEGMISEEEIDQACRRVLQAKYQLGLFDDPYRYIDETRPTKDILTPEHRQFARQLATGSMVLLKNQEQALPLKKSSKIALIGPLANDQNNMLGTWAVSGDRSLSVPVLDGLKEVVGEELDIFYAKGANITNDTLLANKANVFGPRVVIDPRAPEDMITEALQMTQKADVVVAVVGEASEMSGEAASRTSIQLPSSQKRLIAELAKSGKPLVLVVMSGRPLDLSWEQAQADAMLQVWFGGTETGNAVADVLFGNYNPSGKLTMTFPRDVGQIPIYYNHKNTGRPYQENSKFTTQFLDESNEPLYPFGYGLSYTEFEYSELKLDKEQLGFEEPLTISVQVTNTGNIAGEEVVQLYVRDLVGSVTQPVKELKGFEKIHLDAGASKRVNFTLTSADLAFYHSDLSFKAEPGEFKVFVGTDSKEALEANFRLIE